MVLSVIVRNKEEINIVMDPYYHTLIAASMLAVAFFVGKHFSSKSSIEDIVAGILDKLEQDGFIATQVDENGEKELIPVSQLIANALVDAKKTLTNYKN